MSARPAVAAAVCLLAVTLLGCPPSPELSVRYDLVEWAPFAELALESGTIDFGTRRAREHMVDGWSWNETGSDGTSFTWGLGEESVLAFDVLTPREVPVRFRCRPRPSAGAEPSMEVSLNGTPLATVELEASWHERDVTLPAELVRHGRNLLSFRYRMAPAEAVKGEKRNVSLAWDWMRLAGFTGSPPKLRAKTSTLALTAGTRIDFFLDLDEGSQLSFERLELDSKAALRLIASLAVEGAAETEVATLSEGGEAIALPLPESGMARLRLTAVTDRHTREPARATLTHPKILAPVLEAAAATADARPAAPGTEAGPRPNILVYLVDTLRADRLGTYGNDRGLTPYLDALAEEAVVFERAAAQSSWTLPSVASLFTGVWPLTHGAWRRDSQIPPELPIIPELLKPVGYHTGALLSNGWISSERGFDRGVDSFTRTAGGNCESEFQKTSAAMQAWLEELTEKEDGQPFFLYIHTREPHAPYDPPERQRSRFASTATELEIGTPDYLNSVKNGDIPADGGRLARQFDLYDAEVACSDWAFGQTVEMLRRTGAWEDTLVVFVGDHGEEFREHGSLTHGHSLYREMIGVPLVVRFPGGRHGGTRVAWGGQQIDVLPTLLDYLELPRPAHLRGTSLLELIREATSEAALRRRPVFSASRALIASVVVDGWKAIAVRQRLRTDATELYDLVNDPWEQTDVSRERPIRTGYLLAMIREEILASEGAFSAESVEIDSETEAQLKALGYLN